MDDRPVTQTDATRNGQPDHQDVPAAPDPEDQFPFGIDQPESPPPGGGCVYDPASLALSQDFAVEALVKKEWEIIRVERPSKARVFRTHPTYRLKTVLLSLKEDNEVYLVTKPLRSALAQESTCGVFHLFCCLSKQGSPFVWPIRAADAGGKWNIWHQSAYQIALKAEERWCRIQANKDAGHYVAEYDRRTLSQQQPADWPDLSFEQWLELAFREFTITSLDHPVLKRLRLED
jgi:hypothetical protein